MKIIKWADPPASNFGRQASSGRKEALQQLQARPGTWALVETNVSGSAVSAWKKLGCEAVGRKSAKDPKKADIYARWPEPLPEAAPAAVKAAEPKQEPPTATPAKAPAEPARPAKTSLPITTAPTTLDLNDPQDAALLRQRQKYEADRAARLNRGSTR